MKRRIVTATVLGCAVLVATVTAHQSRAKDVELQAAIRTENVDGNLNAAIKQFQAIVDKYGKSDHAVAAEALLHLATCYQRLGDAQAQTVYRRIVREYADQPVAVAVAQSRLASLGGSTNALQSRLVCDDCSDSQAAISADGRWMVMPDWTTGDLKVRDLTSGELKRLMAKPGKFDDADDAGDIAMMPTVSGDGRFIAYFWIDAKTGHVQVRIMPNEVRGTSRVILDVNPDDGRCIPAAISPDGQSVLVEFQKNDGASRLVWASTADRSTKPINAFEWFGAQGVGQRVALSPDGKYIAYMRPAVTPPKPPAKPTSTDTQIYLVSADGSTDEPLITSAGINRTPVWTLDGTRVLFVGNSSGTFDLWSIAVRNGKAAGSPSLVKKDIGDSTGIVVTRSNAYFYEQSHSGVIQTVISRVGASGQQGTAVATVIGGAPTFSPDGKSITVIRPLPNNNRQVVVHSVESGKETVYSRANLEGFPTLWFSDGKSLLKGAAEQDGKQYWFRVDLSTREFTRLSENRGDPKNVTHWNIKTLSPDGKTLYLGTYAGSTGNTINRVVALDLATGTYRTVFMLPGPADNLPQAAQDISIAVSPDGKTLAITTHDSNHAAIESKADMSHLAVVGADGAGYRELVAPFKNPWLRNKLAWSKDGQTIFFATRDNDDTFHIMRVSSMGGAATPTGINVKNLDAFDASPDGSMIAYADLIAVGGREELYRLDLGAVLKTAGSKRP